MGLNPAGVTKARGKLIEIITSLNCFKRDGYQVSFCFSAKALVPEKPRHHRRISARDKCEKKDGCRGLKYVKLSDAHAILCIFAKNCDVKYV